MAAKSGGKGGKSKKGNRDNWDKANAAVSRGRRVIAAGAFDAF